MTKRAVYLTYIYIYDIWSFDGGSVELLALHLHTYLEVQDY